MGRGLQQGQRPLRHEEANARTVNAAANMKLLIDASMSTSAQIEEESLALTQESTRGKRTSSAPASPTTLVHPKPINDGDSTKSVSSLVYQNNLRNLDPNDHARVNDPIARPAKICAKNWRKKERFMGKGDDNHNGNDTESESESSDHVNATKNTPKEPIGFSESILSRLFEPDRKQKPILWEFIRLVAPGPSNQPPKGHYKWRSKDAVAAYCLKCKTAFTYTPGTSKTVSRHLIAHHGYSSSGSAPASTKTEIPNKTSESKPLTPNTKDPAETDININTGSKPPKNPLSFMSRKRGRSIKIGSRKTRTNNFEMDVTETTNRPAGNDDCIVPRNALSPLKKRRVTSVAPTLASKKKELEVLDLLTTDEEDGEDAFLKGHGRNRKAIIEKALFRWWIGSYQSLDCFSIFDDVTKTVFGGGNNSADLFIEFCKTLDDSFELPEPLVMDALAKTCYERLQTEIKIHASQLFPSDTGNVKKSHQFVSASVRRLKVVSIIDSRTRIDTIKGKDSIGRKENVRFHGLSPTGATREVGNWPGTNYKKQSFGQNISGLPSCKTAPGLKIEERIFYPVRLTFCTPMFRMKSYVIAVIPEANETESKHRNQNRNNQKMVSPYSKAVDRALQMYGFPRDNVSGVVIRGSCQHVKEGIRSSMESDEIVCILDRLDGIFATAFGHSATLPRWVQHLLRKDGLHCRENSGKAAQKRTSSSIFFTIRAYERLVASLPLTETIETFQHRCIAKILDSITPIHDAIQTLSTDSYSTIGLSIPILRRVNTLLYKRERFLEEQQNISAEHEDGSDEDEEKEFKEILKSFHHSMLEDFEEQFVEVLEENPKLMWTVPLDPRLIAMRGLSETERSRAKSILIKEVANIVQIIDERDHDKKQKAAPDLLASKTNRRQYSSASTMGGIFWGDDFESTTSDATDSNAVSSTIKDAEYYAKKNVETYFNTVHSQRQIKDPLLWWKNNQDQFPELAMLARKWISASAIYGRKSTRENESGSVVQTSSNDIDSICRMIFLHDNNDIL